MTRITSQLEAYTTKSQPNLAMDQTRYRPFRTPDTPSKVEVLPPPSKVEVLPPPSKVEVLPPPSKVEVLPPPSNSEIKATVIPLEITSDGGSEPPSSTDRTDQSGSAPPTSPSSFEYLGVTALTVLSGLALATIASYIPQLFHAPDTIPETRLSYFDQRALTYNPVSNIFHESSAIQKAINLYSDSLKIEKSSSWTNWLPSSLGITDPDIMHVSHRNNPDVALTCSRLSSSEVACSLDTPLTHEKGSMTVNVKESVEPFFSSIQESMTFPGSYWGSNTIEKIYQLNSNNQLPDLFTQLVSPNHLSTWKGEDGYTFPTQFAKHPPVN